jgi:hypothetical protein
VTKAEQYMKSNPYYMSPEDAVHVVLVIRFDDDSVFVGSPGNMIEDEQNALLRDALQVNGVPYGDDNSVRATPGMQRNPFDLFAGNTVLADA